MANKHYSPLRYPGGKTKLSPFIKQLFYENELIGYDYIEPYAGGAGAALSLLFGEFVRTITINDIDRSLYAFWHSIITENDKFCAEVEKVSIDIDTWEQQKEVQRNKESANLFTLGFSTFYLNRTNVSGVIKGGVIGGIKQAGKYKIDARFNKLDLIERIKKIGKYKDRINVTNADALELLKSDVKGKFIYLDPPYVKKAKNLYMNFYEEKNHIEIANFLLSHQSNFHWLLSYDQTELISNLYKSCKTTLSWNLGYGPSNRKSKEYLFANKYLKVEKSKMLLVS